MTPLLPRRLHAGAWWIWAISLAFAATRTTNPILLGLIVAVAYVVVAARRPATEAATGFHVYLVVALIVIAIRILFRLLLGGDLGDRVLATLPEFAFTGGITVGGPISVEEVLAGAYDGLRLATIIVCIGAANTLADPRRLLASFPRALGGIASAVAVALSLAPQLIESVARVRGARRLRGEQAGGWRSLRSLLVPVLEDTLSRSMALAASMDSRGYGRSSAATAAATRWSRRLGRIGLAIALGGIFALLATGESARASLLILAGVAAAVGSLFLLGRGVARSRYRPDPWAWPEWAVALSGVIAVAGVMATGALTPSRLHPSLEPLQWPGIAPLALGAVLVSVLAAVVSPPPATNAAAVPERQAA